MQSWYVRPGAVRVAQALVALYVAITSVIRLLTERGTSDTILSVLGVLIGLAALAAVLLSLRFDRRRRNTDRRDSAAGPGSQ